jgi:hypothetical protein
MKEIRSYWIANGMDKRPILKSDNERLRKAQKFRKISGIASAKRNRDKKRMG